MSRTFPFLARLGGLGCKAANLASRLAERLAVAHRLDVDPPHPTLAGTARHIIELGGAGRQRRGGPACSRAHRGALGLGVKVADNAPRPAVLDALPELDRGVRLLTCGAAYGRALLEVGALGAIAGGRGAGKRHRGRHQLLRRRCACDSVACKIGAGGEYVGHQSRKKKREYIGAPGGW